MLSTEEWLYGIIRYQWRLFMQNTIQLPQDLYEAIHKKAIAQKKTAEDLINEWVSEH